MNIRINTLRKFALHLVLLALTISPVYAQHKLKPHTRVYSKMYDGTSNANCVLDSVSGILDGDTTTVVNIVYSMFNNKDVGVNKMVVVSYSVVGSSANVYQPIVNDTLYNASITPKILRVDSTSVSESKEYDGLTTCRVTNVGALRGVLPGDDVELSASASFSDKNVGTNKPVTVLYTLTGDDMSNYNVQSSTMLASSILPLDLSVFGTSVSESKEYDGLTTCRVTNVGALRGVLPGDDVELSASASFSDKNVGTDKPVTVSYELSGADSINYNNLETIFLSSTITAKLLTATGLSVVGNKEYDGTTVCAITDTGSLIGVIANDAVYLTAVAAFEDKLVGVNKVVDVTFSIEGSDRSNYLAPVDTILYSSIGARSSWVTGSDILQTKVYDGLDSCSLLSLGVLNNIVEGDTVYCSAVATYDDENVGDNKTVTVNYSLTGKDATNYCYPIPSTYTANITPRQVSVSAVSIETHKVYDGSDSCNIVSAGQLNNTILGDSIAHVVVARYSDKNVGNNKNVTISYSLVGRDSSNYELDNMTEQRLAFISQRPILVRDLSVVPSKIYDGSTDCSVVGGYYPYNVVINDDLTVVSVANYASPHVDTNILVTVNYILTGRDSLNYVISPDTMTADITCRQLYMDSVIIDSAKIYDASFACSIISGGHLRNNVEGDDVSVATNAVFLSSQVADEVPVVVSYVLNGNDRGNYIVPDSDTLYADIVPYQIQVNGLSVRLVKQYDGSDSAIVLTNDTIVFYYESDDVSLVTSVQYNNASVGTNKSIIASYSLNGNQSSNYLPPMDFVYSERGIIVDTTVMDTLNAEGAPFYAMLEGFCQGSDASIAFHVLRGTPTQYKLHFPDSSSIAQNFEDVGWSPMPQENEDEIIYFPIPDNCREGSYVVEVTLRNDAGVEVGPFYVSFTVNLSKQYLVQLFEDVISVNNSGLLDGIPNRFKSYQWYHNGVLIPNANLPYYQEIGGLTGAYSVKVNLGTDEEMMICEKDDFQYETSNCIIDVTPNPVVNVAHITLTNIELDYHLVNLYDMYGTLIMTKTVKGETFDIDMTRLCRGGYILNVDGVTTKIMKF